MIDRILLISAVLAVCGLSALGYLAWLLPYQAGLCYYETHGGEIVPIEAGLWLLAIGMYAGVIAVLAIVVGRAVRRGQWSLLGMLVVIAVTSGCFLVAMQWGNRLVQDPFLEGFAEATRVEFSDDEIEQVVAELRSQNDPIVSDYEGMPKLLREHEVLSCHIESDGAIICYMGAGFSHWGVIFGDERLDSVKSCLSVKRVRSDVHVFRDE